MAQTAPVDDLYDVVSLSSPADQQALRGFIEEIIMAKSKIKDLNSDIKDIRENAKERLNVPPKMLNKWVSIVEKDTMRDLREEYETTERVIALLFPDLANAGDHDNDE